MWGAGHFDIFVALLVEDLGHRGGTGWQCRSAQEHVRDALTAPVGVCLLEHEDRSSGDFGDLGTGRSALGLVDESLWSLVIESLLPGVEGIAGQSHQGCKVPRWQPAAFPGIEDQQSLLRGEGAGVVGRCGGFLERGSWAGSGSWSASSQWRNRGRVGCAEGLVCCRRWCAGRRV